MLSLFNIYNSYFFSAFLCQKEFPEGYWGFIRQKVYDDSLKDCFKITVNKYPSILFKEDFYLKKLVFKWAEDMN